MTANVHQIVRFLSDIAPLQTAADWDNVGLLVGDGAAPVKKIMTCLTVTPTTVAEALREKADLIVTHHPVLFRGAKRLTRDSSDGRMMLDLIKADVAVFSAHTAFDNASDGVNAQIASALGLSDVQPLRSNPKDPKMGEGKWGQSANATLQTCVMSLRQLFGADTMQVCGDLNRKVKNVAIVCGAGGEFIKDAIKVGADVLVTGEIRFHDVLLAEASGVSVIVPGHYATERFAMETLGKKLSAQFTDAGVWASRDERDPLVRV